MKKFLLPMWFIKVSYTFAQITARGSYPLLSNPDSLFCDKPLFIISSGRAGTTLLRNMLVASGEIAIPQEFPVIHKMVLYFLRNGNEDWRELCIAIADILKGTPDFAIWDLSLDEAIEEVAQLPDDNRSLAAIIDTYLRTYATKHFPDAIMWGDQSPLHTFYYPWVIPVYPQARFLHLLRDGRDVVASFQANFKDELSLQQATDRWIQSVHRARQIRDTLPPEQFLEIRYEDLVSQSEQTLQSIANFSSICYHKSMLNYWQLSSTVEHKHLDIHKNVGKPVFTSSIGKWKERLSSEQQNYISGKMKPLLQSLGYSVDI